MNKNDLLEDQKELLQEQKARKQFSNIPLQTNNNVETSNISIQNNNNNEETNNFDYENYNNQESFIKENESNKNLQLDKNIKENNAQTIQSPINLTTEIPFEKTTKQMEENLTIALNYIPISLKIKNNVTTPSPEELLLRGINIPLENVPFQNPWEQKLEIETSKNFNSGLSNENLSEKIQEELPCTTPESLNNTESFDQESQIFKRLLEKYGANGT